MAPWRLAALGHAEPEWVPAPGILARGKWVPWLIFPMVGLGEHPGGGNADAVSCGEHRAAGEAAASLAGSPVGK